MYSLSKITLEGPSIINLICRDEPGPILVPPEDGDGAPVNGGLLKKLLVVVVVCGDLSTPPANGDDLFLGVPLHALHHH